ncbi:hypothetical protein BU24DRAFT_420738 [Aaosphaeria arxii CBS 175.79]|uniref:Uncharacterized protein n=1 Tax=Aaosphaeria arxii CBS 175.79 TaxID=1450172 RepID=A0A6A5XWI2_9PLEO|nr:uncharacterized protein BU24DRAFT_420738 [Aaosphaeria arxii CBS 175.79]KAF2017688.1 hypothetical protein BU24DRAFT_420738 [Aaosphaeria arxii CBS 175.79]
MDGLSATIYSTYFDPHPIYEVSGFNSGPPLCVLFSSSLYAHIHTAFLSVVGSMCGACLLLVSVLDCVDVYLIFEMSI